MNRTSIPPTMIMNKIYENQKLADNVPVIKATRITCINNVNPIESGWVIMENTRVNITIKFIISRLMQRIVYKNINFGD